MNKSWLQAAQKDLRGEAREDRSFGSAQDGLGGGVLFSYVDTKSVERTLRQCSGQSAYESLSAACHPALALSAFVQLLDETAVVQFFDKPHIDKVLRLRSLCFWVRLRE